MMGTQEDVRLASDLGLDQRERALSLFYDEGKTLGEIAEILNLPRGIYDLSPWIYSTHMREQMRQRGR